MGNLSAADVLDRLAALGCCVRLDGEKLRIRGPVQPEVAVLVSELRARREEAISLVRALAHRPPSREEVESALPNGVRVLRYEPKAVPFTVCLASVVTNAGRFFRAYLSDLKWRLAHPDTYATPPLTDILTKLSDAGLDLIVDGDQPVAAAPRSDLSDGG